MNDLAIKKSLLEIILVIGIGTSILTTPANAENLCKTDGDCGSHCGAGCGKPCITSVVFECFCVKGACLEQSEFAKKIKAEKWQEPDCNNQMTTIHGREVCITELARITKDEMLCSHIKEDSFFNVCMEGIAGENGDISFCEKLRPSKNAMAGRSTYTLFDFCVEGIAVHQQNASLCKKLTGKGKDFCFSQVALAIMDPKLCYESREEKYRCLDLIAINTNNQEICKELENQKAIDSCIDSVTVRIKRGIGTKGGLK